MSFLNLTVSDISQKLQNKEVSSVEVTEEVISQVQKKSEMNSFITESFEDALASAKNIDNRRSSGEKLGVLAGIPMSIKDVILVKGVRATAASKILENYVAPYSSTVTKKLQKEGIVMIGKNNCDEFAMGASNEKSAYGVVRNPWDLDRVPGGSSGGSASAVASGQGYYSIGTDTGGSVRQPASFCGVVGMKPSYGRVSRYGVMSLCSSFDQVGPITKDVRDSALVMNVIAGHDSKDSTSSVKVVPDYTKALDLGVKNMKIGVPKQFFVDGMDSNVVDTVKKAISDLEKQGAEIVEVDLPLVKHAIAVYYTILPSEASANLARYDGIRFGVRVKDEVSNLLESYMESRGQGIGAEPKRRIMIGTHALSSGYYDAYYVQAQKVRAAIKRDFDKVFEQVDVLVGPTTPTIAFKIGEKFENPLTMYLEDIFTAPANIAGLCAISVPCGLAKSMPVGLQIMGNQFDEEVVYRVAGAYEQVSHWNSLGV